MCVCVCVSGFVAVWIRREMPKRTRNTRKNEPSAPSGVSQERMAAIAGGMERDSVESLLEDFDVQTAAITKQALKQFEKEAKLLMSALPQKTSIPREVLKMELSEFIGRGGSFHAVWESLKKEKCKVPSPELERKEAPQENKAPEPPESGTQDLFVTPAMSTRSQRLREQTTAKRKPRPLEEIKVQAYSNTSGSPVDEKMLLQLHSDEIMGDIQDKIMEATAKFPQKWRAKLVQSLREMKAQATVKDDVFVTPAIRR